MIKRSDCVYLFVLRNEFAKELKRPETYDRATEFLRKIGYQPNGGE